ncbi:MAG: polysaccharide deacetylase family protein [Acidimicrobiales bacterium]
MTARDIAVRALRSAPVTSASRRATRRRLRVLAYHGVPDPANFGLHMTHIAERYVPVDEAAVAASLAGRAKLPDHAVWITFDDGDPTVVTHGLPILAELKIPATMFICPGLVESGEPFWWRLSDAVGSDVPDDVEAELAAMTAGVDRGEYAAVSFTERLKGVDDEDRRRLLGRTSIVAGSRPSSWRQLSSAELEAWQSAGMSVGNHSWDHPCLDKCDESEQLRQVEESHRWLVDAGIRPRAFAYPNGNHSETVERALVDLGYELAVLHDNRLADTTLSPLRISRLRVEADEQVERLVSVASGAQPTADSLRGRLSV